MVLHECFETLYISMSTDFSNISGRSAFAVNVSTLNSSRSETFSIWKFSTRMEEKVASVSSGRSIRTIYTNGTSLSRLKNFKTFDSISVQFIFESVYDKSNLFRVLKDAKLIPCIFLGRIILKYLHFGNSSIFCVKEKV